MAKAALADKIAQGYTHFRSSLWYPAGIVLFAVTWYALNKVFNFDPDCVILLAILSVEASVATGLNSRDLANVERDTKQLLKYMLHQLEIIKANTRPN